MTGFGDPTLIRIHRSIASFRCPRRIDPNLDIPDPVNDPYTFRVNAATATANAQTNPCVAMDPQGDFVIAYQTQGPSQGYFNDIIVRKFDRNGKPLDSGVTVNDVATNINFSPYVAMDNLGDYVVAWSYTADPNYGTGKAIYASLEAKLYSSTEQVLLGTEPVERAGRRQRRQRDRRLRQPTTIWRCRWDEASDTDNNGTTSEGVYAAEWQVYQRRRQQQHRHHPHRRPGRSPERSCVAKYRVNSAAVATTTTTANPANPTAPSTTTKIGNTSWPGYQGHSQVAMDASGDMTISYQGVGPDVSTNINIPAGTPRTPTCKTSWRTRPTPTCRPSPFRDPQRGEHRHRRRAATPPTAT